MDDQNRQIADRLKGLRDALELTAEEVAKDCDLSVEEYRTMEAGECDMSISILQRIAHRYGITTEELMFGAEAKMNAYFLTRKGAGVSVERVKAYKYELLASGFKGRIADPFIVTIEPKPEGTPLYFNSHDGQEFQMVIEGRLLVNIDGKELTLEPGDSLYFDSSIPHGLKALDGKQLVQILTEPKNALVKQYKKLLEYDNVELEFTPEALEAAAQKAVERKIGARGLRAVLEEVMTPIMYDVPSDDSIAKVIITPEAIRGEQPPEVVREEGRPARPRLGAASLRAEPGGQAARKGNAS